MSDSLALVRNLGIAGLAIAVLVCIGGLVLFQEEFTGAVHLNRAQSQMMDAVARTEPGAVVEWVDVTERSAAMVIGVAGDTPPDEIARLQDSVWTAYVDAFGKQGMAISHVAVAEKLPGGGVATEFRGIVDVATLAARTGMQPPALHPMYGNRELFDPATEAPPALPDAGD